MNAPDNHLERRARALYREAAVQLDPAVAARLRAARRDALASTRESWAHRLLQLLLPAGAFAAIAFVALFMSSPVQRTTSSAPTAIQAVDAADGELPPDAAAADPTLYQNMDFYGWLAKNGDSEASR